MKKKLNSIETEKIINKIIDYYKENTEKYKNEIKRLERKKSLLYKKKCEKYITVEEFKNEYERAKQEIRKYKIKIEEIEQENESIFDEERIKKTIKEIRRGKGFTNDFLKEIINRIEVYSKLKIEITFF